MSEHLHVEQWVVRAVDWADEADFGSMCLANRFKILLAAERAD
jgi:hypothetical protein